MIELSVVNTQIISCTFGLDVIIVVVSSQICKSTDILQYAQSEKFQMQTVPFYSTIHQVSIHDEPQLMIIIIGIQKFFDPLFKEWNTKTVGGAKLNEKMSFSDLVTLAGVVAIENAVSFQKGLYSHSSDLDTCWNA